MTIHIRNVTIFLIQHDCNTGLFSCVLDCSLILCLKYISSLTQCLKKEYKNKFHKNNRTTELSLTALPLKKLFLPVESSRHSVVLQGHVGLDPASDIVRKQPHRIWPLHTLSPASSASSSSRAVFFPGLKIINYDPE